jgi:hypothetical protein
VATQAYVTQQFKELLGRAPDSGGLQHYMGYSDPGEVRSSIMSSSEYKKRQGSSKPATKSPAGGAPNERAVLEKEVAGLFGELDTFDKTTKAPVDAYNEALAGLGLTDARTRVTNTREQLMNTESLLKNISGNVQARTQDFNVSQAQRDRLTAAETGELSGQYDSFSRALEGAMGDYGLILDEGKTQADLTFEGDQAKRQGIMDRLQIKIDQSKSVEDRRRWETELSRLKAQDAEEKRRFDADLALKRQEATRLAKGSSTSTSNSRTDAKTAAQQEVSKYILGPKVRGGDGYISPVTYRQLKSEWVGAGYAAKEFDAQFSMYANPKHRKDYGL